MARRRWKRRTRAALVEEPQTATKRRSAVNQRTTRHAEYEVSQRKRVEQSFGWMKMVGMLKKVKLRGIDKVGWLFTFTGAAYNLCRLRT